MSARSELIEQLNSHGFLGNMEGIADFILEDRKRIVRPLVELRKDVRKLGTDLKNYRGLSIEDAIDETIKLSGVSDESPNDS